jgi:Na+-translocating ferredoxin:NAD+ oxidoreductase RnfG subunit
MTKLIFILYLLTGFSLLNSQDPILTKKEKKEASRIFSGELELEHVDLGDHNLSLDSLLKEGDRVFKFLREAELAGYMLRSSAKGRYEKFDYIIFYTPDLAVLGVKVTAYRSTHGAAICQTKWLGQFQGYEGGELVLGRDIDAISGASISARSMVEDIQRCFLLMSRLEE